jgi:DNA-binding winged helix-turn-helix (wHTH) protein
MDSPGPNFTYRFGDFMLDPACRTLSCAGDAVPLAPKEFLALTLLVQAAGKAVSRETLIAAVWPDTAVSDNSLARCISSLRRHLGADAIEVVPKFGYRFTLPVTLAETTAALNTTMATPTASQTMATATPRLTVWHRPAVRFGLAAAVLVLVAGLSAARLISPRHATAATPPLTWTDPQTQLTWAGKDNGFDVNRQQAIDYCRNLTLAGHQDWRLPTIDEVQTLYDTGISLPGVWGPVRPVYWHVKGNLHLTGGETAVSISWPTEANPTGEEQSYDFSYGRRNLDALDFHADHRALCVR